MGQVTQLRHEEGVRLDSERIAALYAELGDTGAEHVICRAVEEMAVRLTEMEGQRRGTDLAPFCRNARCLGRLAGQVGMTGLARVANDVAASAVAGEPAAASATWARLLRIGDRSLTAVWDVRDLSV